MLPPIVLQRDTEQPSGEGAFPVRSVAHGAGHRGQAVLREGGVEVCCTVLPYACMSRGKGPRCLSCVCREPGGAWEACSMLFVAAGLSQRCSRGCGTQISRCACVMPPRSVHAYQVTECGAAAAVRAGMLIRGGPQFVAPRAALSSYPWCGLQMGEPGRWDFDDWAMRQPDPWVPPELGAALDHGFVPRSDALPPQAPGTVRVRGSRAVRMTGQQVSTLLNYLGGGLQGWDGPGTFTDFLAANTGFDGCLTMARGADGTALRAGMCEPRKQAYARCRYKVGRFPKSTARKHDDPVWLSLPVFMAYCRLGPPPPLHGVSHMCNSRSSHPATPESLCCNPWHLEWMTQEGNIWMMHP